jgi:nucleoside phosphorylase
MTRVAIIAAMPDELKPLTRGWRHSRTNGVDLWHQSFDGGEWIAACAGAGVAAATRAFAEAEKCGELDAVISTGWAGALLEELETGRAYWVPGVIDARTGERFFAESHPSRNNKDAARVGHPETEALKGHGFSRAAEVQNSDVALAAEGMPAEKRTIPQGLRPITINESSDGTTEVVPFQNDLQDDHENKIQNELWLVTCARVADAAEKQRLAATYSAAMADMEAAAVARLAQMRGIPFYCVKGISDGYSDHLPDFNRFISADGRFQLARFVIFAVLRPWHWPALIRMGENSKKAARDISESLLDLLDE